MNQEKPHITEYSTYGWVLALLLLLTGLSVWVTHMKLAALTAGVALLVTCVMAFLILIYFMHLKFDNLLIKIMVALVFILFIILIGVTMLDYYYTIGF